MSETLATAVRDLARDAETIGFMRPFMRPAHCPWDGKWLGDTDGTQIEAICPKCKRPVVGRVAEAVR